MKKSCLGRKNLDNQASTGRIKTVDPGALSQGIETNLESIRQNSGSAWFITFTTSAKALEVNECYQNIAKLLTHPKYKHSFSKNAVQQVWFDGISTIVGYLMPNPLYTYILNMYDLVGLGFMA